MHKAEPHTLETARGEDRWLIPVLTADQVRALPASVEFVLAARCFGYRRSAAFEAVRRHEFPVAVRKVGRGYRVRQSDLLAELGIPEVPAAREPESGDAA